MVGSIGYCYGKGGTEAHAVFCALDADPVVTISIHVRGLSCQYSPINDDAVASDLIRRKVVVVAQGVLDIERSACRRVGIGTACG